MSLDVVQQRISNSIKNAVMSYIVKVAYYSIE